ncbi:hypothetical protein Tco_1336583 [Tanacetum coccineum]|uniref:Uncharacterized protein n=1 Tax=Tanacetum coccineum TaxID=301880 RepID=A0ABQ5F0X9_9ASTR
MSLDKASQNVYTKLESIFIDGGPIRIGVKGTLLIAVVIGTMIGLTESPKVSLSLHLALPVESSHFLQTGVKIGGSEMIEVESPLSVKSRDFWEHTQPSCTIGMSCAQKLGLPKIKGTPSTFKNPPVELEVARHRSVIGHWESDSVSKIGIALAVARERLTGLPSFGIVVFQEERSCACIVK